MPDGRTKHKTYIGVLFTVILLGIILFFAVLRIGNVKQGPVVIESVEEDYFGVDHIWSSDDANFRFAFGITAFDGGKQAEEDESLYGKMVAKAVTWGLSGQEDGYHEEILDISQCTAEQLGLEAGKED